MDCFGADSKSNNKIQGDSKFVSSAFKDIDIENKLLASSKFDDCKGIYTQDPTKIDETLECTEKIIKTIPANEAKELLAKLNVDLTQSEGDSLTQKLAKFVTKKMKEALYGTNPPDPNKIPITDQKTFILIYERFLTRTIMLELSSYCLKNEASNAGKGTSIYSLEKVQALDSNTTEDKFTSCLGTLKDSCAKVATLKDKASDTERRGCLLKNRFLAYKGVIKELRENDKYWKELQEHKSWGFSETETTKIKKKTNKELQNEIALLSSTEIVEGLGGQEGADKLAAEFDQKCKSGDKKACEEYAKFGSKESMGAVRIKKEMELDLKLKLVEDATNNKQSMEELAKKENLFSSEELKNKPIEELKKALMEHYNSEKTALKKTIQENIDKIGLSKNDDQSKTDAKIKNLHENLKNKPEELRAVFFYASLLQEKISVKDKNGNELGKDYDSIKREVEKLKESKNQQPNPGLVDTAIKYLEDKSTSANRSIASSNNENSKTLDIDFIDKILGTDKGQQPNGQSN